MASYECERAVRESIDDPKDLDNAPGLMAVMALAKALDVRLNRIEVQVAKTIKTF